MRDSGRMLASVLEILMARAEPGMSTKDLADLAARELTALGGKASFLGYQGFPDVLCVSLNNEVVHGIPNKERIIANGDILSLDFGVTYKGMITDGARSLIVGKPKQQRHQQLVERTERSMYAGINAVHDRVHEHDVRERKGRDGERVLRSVEQPDRGLVRIGQAVDAGNDLANRGGVARVLRHILARDRLNREEAHASAQFRPALEQRFVARGSRARRSLTARGGRHAR